LSYSFRTKTMWFFQFQVEDPGLWAGKGKNFNYGNISNISRVEIWVWRPPGGGRKNSSFHSDTIYL